MVSFHRSGSTATDENGADARVTAPALPSSTAAFPRVNLMPDTITSEAKVHRAKLVLGIAAAASVALVGGLYVLASADVSGAQDQLDTATARGAVLATEAAKYADVPKVQAEVAAAQTQQYEAMGSEVRWSFLLNNLALTMPAGSSLTGFAGVVSTTPPVTAAGAKVASAGDLSAGSTSVLGRPGIGTITYEGEARGYPNVAAFLDAMAKQKTLLDPYATFVGAVPVQKGEPSKGFTFTSQAAVSDAALSRRYDLKAGN